LRNKAVKSRIRTETREFERAIERADAEQARTQLQLLTKLLHKASAKGVLHTRTAARRQARLQKHFNERVAGGS